MLLRIREISKDKVKIINASSDIMEIFKIAKFQKLFIIKGE